MSRQENKCIVKRHELKGFFGWLNHDFEGIKCNCEVWYRKSYDCIRHLSGDALFVSFHVLSSLKSFVMLNLLPLFNIHTKIYLISGKPHFSSLLSYSSCIYMVFPVYYTLHTGTHCKNKKKRIVFFLTHFISHVFRMIFCLKLETVLKLFSCHVCRNINDIFSKYTHTHHTELRH